MFDAISKKKILTKQKLIKNITERILVKGMLDNDDDLNDEAGQNDYFNSLNLQKINNCIGDQTYDL
jgi:hypothetical protein